MGVSPSLVTYLLQGARTWSDELRAAAAAALDVPVHILFEECMDDNTDTTTDGGAAGAAAPGHGGAGVCAAVTGKDGGDA
jgi:hypothetical protein